MDRYLILLFLQTTFNQINWLNYLSHDVILNGQDTIPAFSDLMQFEEIKNTIIAEPREVSSLGAIVTASFFDKVDILTDASTSTGIQLIIPLEDGRIVDTHDHNPDLSYVFGD